MTTNEQLDNPKCRCGAEMMRTDLEQAARLKDICFQSYKKEMEPGKVIISKMGRRLKIEYKETEQSLTIRTLKASLISHISKSLYGRWKCSACSTKESGYSAIARTIFSIEALPMEKIMSEES